MAKGYGFFGGLAQGLETGSRLLNDQKQREAADLAAQRAKIELEDAQKTRSNAPAAVASSIKHTNPTDPGNPGFDGDARMRSEKSNANAEQATAAIAPMAAVTRRPIYDDFGDVAKFAFNQNDLVTGQKFMDASAALKTQHYMQGFDEARRTQNLDGMVALINDYPNGQKYSAQHDPQTGRIVAVARNMEGNPLGQLEFDNVSKLGEFIQQRINPGDIHKRNIEEATRRMGQISADAGAERPRGEFVKSSAGQNLGFKNLLDPQGRAAFDAQSRGGLASTTDAVLPRLKSATELAALPGNTRFVDPGDRVRVKA
ncbi:MAG: hypothetical protein V4772_07300 [Pseudomonadota bacterium]